MRVVPDALARTRPLVETVATAAFSLLQLTLRPESVLPFASRVDAVSCCVTFGATVNDAGDTVTEATGTFVTVIVACPLRPSLVAVTTAEPAATPRTNPPLTVATDVLLLVQAIGRPESVLPFASRVVACSCVVPLVGTVDEDGVTETLATAAGCSEDVSAGGGGGASPHPMGWVLTTMLSK